MTSVYHANRRKKNLQYAYQRKRKIRYMLSRQEDDQEEAEALATYETLDF